MREPRKNYPKEEELFQDKLHAGLFLPAVLLASGNAPKDRAEGGLAHLAVLVLTHHRDLRLSVVDVAGIEVSHPLLKTWLGVVDGKGRHRLGW